jgi:peptide/nickel transport system permease protein
MATPADTTAVGGRSDAASDVPQRRSIWRRLGRSGSFRFGLVVLLVTVAVAAFAPALAPHDPMRMDYGSILAAPSERHVFGTDDFGRDVLSRVIVGSRVSLQVGLTVTLLTLVGGLIVGVAAGYYPKVDNVLMRVMDMLMAFPDVLLAIAVMAILGPRIENVIIALSVIYVPRSARVVRSAVLNLRELEFVEAARALGTRDLALLMRHVVPNAMPHLIVQQTFVFAYSILAEATLSFLGIGAPAGVPSWGNILSDGRSLLQVAPWLILFPGAVLSVVVMGINLLGDGLRDVLDPRMRL